MATFRGSGSVESGLAFPTEAELQAAVTEAVSAGVEAEAAQAAAEIAQAQAEVAQNLAETAETGSVAAQALSEAAQAAAEAAQAAAEAAQAAAAASAAAALVSEGLADADAIATAADLVATNQDTIDTAADVVLSAAEVSYAEEWANKIEDSLVSAAAGGDLIDDFSSLHWANKANAWAVLTAADAVTTNQDAIDTAADLVATNQDTIDTAADLALTNADVVSTNADVVTTNADAVLTAADVATVEGIYDDFDDRYLGSKASDPTLDNDGNALLDGAMYWNTTTPELLLYDLTGTIWVSLGGLTEEGADLLYQPLDADLTALAALTQAKGRMIVSTGSAWTGIPVGTNGDVLTADSAQAVGIAWAPPTDYGWKYLNIITKTSGTNAQWATIPTGTTEVQILYEDCSSNGTNRLSCQLGYAAGFVSAGYAGSVDREGSGSVAWPSDRALLVAGNTAAAFYTGIFTWSRAHTSNDEWFGSSFGYSIKSNTTVNNSNGYVDVTLELSRLKVIWSGTNTFDSGTIVLRYR